MWEVATQMVKAGKSKIVNLGPEEYNTKKSQAVVVTLPDKEVTTQLGAPFAGNIFSTEDVGPNLGGVVGAGSAQPASQIRQQRDSATRARAFRTSAMTGPPEVCIDHTGPTRRGQSPG